MYKFINEVVLSKRIQFIEGRSIGRGIKCISVLARSQKAFQKINTFLSLSDAGTHAFDLLIQVLQRSFVGFFPLSLQVSGPLGSIIVLLSSSLVSLVLL